MKNQTRDLYTVSLRLEKDEVVTLSDFDFTEADLNLEDPKEVENINLLLQNITEQANKVIAMSSYFDDMAKLSGMLNELPKGVLFREDEIYCGYESDYGTASSVFGLWLPSSMEC